MFMRQAKVVSSITNPPPFQPQTGCLGGSSSNKFVMTSSLRKCDLMIIHNWNKICESDWLLTAVVKTVYASLLHNWRVHAIGCAVTGQLHFNEFFSLHLKIANETADIPFYKMFTSDFFTKILF